MPHVYRRKPPPPMLPIHQDIPSPARVLARVRSGAMTLSKILGGFDAEEWCDAAWELDRLVESGQVTCRIERSGRWTEIAKYQVRVIQVFSFMEANAHASSR